MLCFRKNHYTDRRAYPDRWHGTGLIGRSLNQSSDVEIEAKQRIYDVSQNDDNQKIFYSALIYALRSRRFSRDFSLEMLSNRKKEDRLERERKKNPRHSSKYFLPLS